MEDMTNQTPDTAAFSPQDVPAAQSVSYAPSHASGRRRGAAHIKRRRFSLEGKGPYLVAFLLPVLMMIAIQAGKGVFPFGKTAFLRVDEYHQYAPFHAHLWQKIHDGGSLLYTWTIGLGTNYTPLFAYYLSTPFNFLLFLVPRSLVLEFMALSVTIKMGLCGVTMTKYLKHRFGELTLPMALFGTLYAMSAFLAAYSWNLMWLDCLILAPLILMGLERLLDGGSGALYGVTLGLSILCNYYISIMICIFLVLWCVTYLFMKPRMKFRDESGQVVRKVSFGRAIVSPLVRFALWSLVAGGVAAVLLVPVGMALSLTASGKFSFPRTFTSYFSIFDMLVRHLTLVEPELGLDHWPNIYSGIICLPLFALYLMDEDVPVREKFAKGALLLFLFLSFSTNILNFIWHGFHYPNSLPSRQSFLYTIVVVSCCYEAARSLPRISKVRAAAALLFSFVFILLAEKLASEGQEIDFWVYYVNAAFLGIYALIAMTWIGRKHLRRAALVAFAAVLTLELTLNMAVTSVTVVNRPAYMSQLTETTQILTRVKNSDKGFYRIEREDRRTKDDGSWYGYPSASVFSSTAHAGVTDLYKKLGLEGNTNAYAYNGGTPFTRALFSIKYQLTTRKEASSPLEEAVTSSGDVTLMRYADVLPVAFMVPADMESRWSNQSSKVENQNRFAAYSDPTGNDDPLFVEVSRYTENTVDLNFPTDGYYVAELTGKKPDSVTVKIDGEASRTLSSIDRGYLIDLGWRRAGTGATVSSKEDFSLSLGLYRMSEDRLHQYVADMNKGGLTVTNRTDTVIEGTVTAAKDGLLLTTIPWEEGWTVTVDGRKVQTRPFDKAFVALPMFAGEHTVRFSYMPKGLEVGALVSAGSVLLMAVAILVPRLRHAPEEDEEEEENAAEEDAETAEDAAEETEAPAEA
ncbi:MAG: YfhO family protein [Lachnospiraceae bacterium]|nr:YfhO family protein [Lachnospiraceae bacterium]